MTTPTEEQMEEQLGRAIDEDGKWPGMNYTDGVRNALSWVLGESDTGPMDDE